MFRIIGGDRQEYGPVTAEQLRHWIAEKRVNGQTLTRREQDSEWKPLSSWPELDMTSAAGPGTPVPTSDPIGTVIPYRNMPALISYYLAVFSSIPCLGIPLGLAAVVLGLIGLKRARERPEARGRVHAWVGIVFGALFGLGYLVLLGLFVSNRTGDF